MGYKSISHFMSNNVLTANRDMLAKEAARIMLEMEIHHLPIVDQEGKFVGMFSSHDAMTLFQYPGTNSNLTVEDMMSVKPLIFLGPEDEIKKAFVLFREFNILSIPVIEDFKITGILTIHDILKKTELAFR